MATPLDRARAFLSAGPIAVVGVSRDEKDFSRYLFRELLRRGLDVVPVNPALAEAEGRRAFARLQDVTPRAQAALLLTRPAAAEPVLREAVAAGIRKVWLHRGAGAGVATPATLAFCAASGLEVIHDLCPMMALEGAAFPHRIHGYFRLRHLAKAGRAAP